MRLVLFRIGHWAPVPDWFAAFIWIWRWVVLSWCSGSVIMCRFSWDASEEHIRCCDKAAATCSTFSASVAAKGDIIPFYALFYQFVTTFWAFIKMRDTGFGQNTCWFKLSGVTLFRHIFLNGLFSGMETLQMLQPSLLVTSYLSSKQATTIENGCWR